ncbi:hypothetical protein FRC01_005235 [Tulasnella sp. 417]|nr:hypothetical protein FRC01_005235 [Tulasnella sp. 417]
MAQERPQVPPLSFKQAVKQVIKNERESRAHQLFRAYPGHDRVGLHQEGVRDQPDEDTMPGIMSPGATGVIYCTDRAMANGFKYGDPAWSNLGQGAPEVGPLPDAPARPDTFTFPEDSFEYGPTTGIKSLREAVAKLYNETYRYTGYQIPDYSAYSEMLGVFKRLVPIPTATRRILSAKTISRGKKSLQVAAIPLLDPEHVHKERIALQRHFLAKRDHVLNRLEKMGLKVAVPPIATFYIWLDLSDLPAPLDNGLTFFEELLKEKTICVPGIFFDLNPAHRRDLFASPCHHFVRLSFGPPLDQLDKGLDAIERVLAKVNKEGMDGIGKDYPLSPTMRKIPEWAEDKAEEAEGGMRSLVQKLTGL